MQWYIATNGQQKGPFTEEQFQEFARKGEILQTSMVWRSDMPDWITYQQYSDQCQAVTGTMSVAPSYQPQMPAQQEFDQAPEFAAQTYPHDDSIDYCTRCNSALPKNQLIYFKGQAICGNCKADFFQGVSEHGKQSYANYQPALSYSPYNSPVSFFKDPSALGKAAGILLLINALLAMVNVVLSAYILNLIDSKLDSSGDVATFKSIMPAQIASMVVGGLQNLASLASLILFFIWIYRAYSNLQPLKKQQRMTPAGAWAWFLCPIMQIFKPIIAIQDLAKGTSDDSAKTYASIWSFLWIGVFLAGMISVLFIVLNAMDNVSHTNISHGSGPFNGKSELQLFGGVGLISPVVLALANIVLSMLVFKISAAQTKDWRTISSGSLQRNKM